MKLSEFDALISNASTDFKRANTHLAPASPRPNAVMECDSRVAALAPSKAKEADSERVHIRFVSVRKRLLDPDNLSEKWLLDCLRFCGAIKGDEPEKITLETTQRKAAKGEEEHTIIEIYTQPR